MTFLSEWLVTQCFLLNVLTNLPFQRYSSFLSCNPFGDDRLPSVTCDGRSQQHLKEETPCHVSKQVPCNRLVWPTVQLKFSLNVPKGFLLAAARLHSEKAATNWTLTTATSVRHARSVVIAPVQRRTNQPDGPMPHLEAIHSLKREAGRGRGFTGTGSMAHFRSLCFLFGRLCLYACLCSF